MKANLSSLNSARLLLIGAGLAAYLSAGLWYFETYTVGWAHLLTGILLGAACAGAAWNLGRLGLGWRSMLLSGVVVGGSVSLAWLLSGVLLGTDLDGAQWTKVHLHTAVVGILPLIALLLLWPTGPKAAASPAPATTDVQAQAPPVEAPAPSPEAPAPLLKFEGNTGEQPLLLAAADLIFIEAADNYCKFHYLQDGKRRQKLLRLTLREAEEALIGAQGFHRCHRSFLVNGQHVLEVMGHSQAYRLRLAHAEEPVPVSRSFDVSVLGIQGEG